MFDPFSLAAGAGILAAGYVTGRVGRRNAAIPQPAPAGTCGCGHPRALHALDANVCHAEVERPHYLKSGERNGKEWVPCTCKLYDGPKPIEDLFAPQYLPPAG